MNRRQFSKLLGMGSVAAAAFPAAAGDSKGGEPFKALFAPHPGQLPTAPRDYIDQLRFAWDLGFRAWEDNGLLKRPASLQDKVGDFVREKGMALGVTVICDGHGTAFFKADEKQIKAILGDMKKGVEVAKRTVQTHMTMIPGIRVKGTPLAEQIRGAAGLMKRCCDIVEEHGIILSQEPLSHGVKGGPPLLRSFVDGFELCQAVDRPACKVLADFYHEGQIGNQLIPNAEKIWSHAAYVQYGDVPGRKEPGSGKLDLGEVTRWLREQKYEGVIGMEHGVSAKGKAGLEKLLAAYRKIDA